MPRAGLTEARVVDEAGLVADETGSPAVNLATLAARLGVQVPSLYKHVSGADDLHRLVSLRARTELADALARATVGRSRDEAVAAIASAYRDWAVAHPGRYPLTLRAPRLDDPADLEASGRAVGVMFDALAGYGLVDDDAIDATRMLRSVLHGFVSLNAAGAFELPDLDRSFRRMVASVQHALRDWHTVTI